MVYNQTLTIWELPPQPLLPVNDIRDPVFLTIWLAGSFAAAFYLRTLLKRNEKTTWQEFGNVRYGALCLTIWYLARTTDRWLRYDQRTAVKYGYALAEPMIDTLRITSTILILWGTYTVVWKELEDQFSPKQQGIWWFAARFLLFIVTLMAIFYVILSIALSVVWLEFFNLNSIADIAGKRNDFEMAMTSFFLLFSLLTLAEATVAWFHAFKIHGQVQRTRLFMWLGALFLFVRSASELAIVNDLFHFRASRQNMKFTIDVSYGFITMLYFAMMCLMAKVAASTFDSGGTQAKMVASDVRHYILSMLESQTNGGRTESLPFETVLREVERNLDSVLSRGPLTGGLGMNSSYKEAVAMDCIAQIRNEFGRLDPREDNDDNLRPPSTLSVLTSLLGRQSRQSHNFSSTTLHTNTTRPWPSSASGITAVPATPNHPQSFRKTPSVYSDVPDATFPAPPVNPVPHAGPPPTTNFDGPRWEPSLGAFPEHPQPYEGASTSEYPQPSIPIAASPPPLATGAAQVTRRHVPDAVPPPVQALPTVDTGSSATSHQEPPLHPAVSSAPTASPATVPAHSVSVPNIFPGGYSQQMPARGEQVRGEGLLYGTPIAVNSISLHYPHGGEPISTSRQKDAMPSQPTAEYARHAQVSPSSSSQPASLAPFPSEMGRSKQGWGAVPRWSAEPKAESSASAKRKSTSPLATTGSSYRSLQAQRASGGGPTTDTSPTASGSGYQIQPYSSTGGSSTAAATTSTAGPSKRSSRGLIKNILSDTGPSRHSGPSRQHRASPVPTSVPKPTPPPPPRAIYSADAFDIAPTSNDGYNYNDYDGGGWADDHRAGNQHHDQVYYADNRGRLHDELPPLPSEVRHQQGSGGSGTASGGGTGSGDRDSGPRKPRYA